MDVVVDHDRRRTGAVTQAIDSFERETPVRGRRAGFRAQRRLGMSEQPLGSHGLAGLGPADAHYVPAGRLLTEVVIEGDDPVYLRPGEIQRVRDDWNRGRRDMTEPVL